MTNNELKPKEIIPREIALKILYDIDKNNAYANLSLKKHLKLGGAAISSVDRNFITELIYGIIKRKITMDYIIGQFSSIRIKKISPWILNVLRMGIYQLIFLDKIPESAVCNEAVKLAKKYGHSSSANYVNAVLRNISRSKSSIKYPDKNKNTVSYLSVIYSHPEWMIKEWLESYGEKFTIELLEANNLRPESTFRANTLKITANLLIERFKGKYIEAKNEKYIEAKKGTYHPDAFILSSAGNIEDLDEYKEGLFYPQDESSMFVATVLDPKPGELVIDVCCAPGGKTTHIAQIMKNTGKVVGWDIHEHKITLVKRSAKRLGIDIIEANFSDAGIDNPEFFEKADRVLVDAPCTGLGIIRRKPDIKWNRESEALEDLVPLQNRILNVSSKYVKIGGTLVYSTCTLNDKENIQVVQAFLKANPNFEAEDISSFFPDQLKKSTMREGYVQFFPNVDKIDGFFIFKMKRVN